MKRDFTALCALPFGLGGTEIEWLKLHSGGVVCGHRGQSDAVRSLVAQKYRRRVAIDSGGSEEIITYLCAVAYQEKW